MSIILIWTNLAIVLLGLNAALDWQTTYLSDKLNVAVILSSLMLVPFDLQFWRQALLWGVVNVVVYEVLYLCGLLYFGDVKYAFGLGMLLATSGGIEQYLFAQIITFALLTAFALIQLTRKAHTLIALANSANGRSHTENVKHFTFYVLRFTFSNFSAQQITRHIEFPAAPLMFLGAVLVLL
jgi:hypothetical protein